jgi:hypothetical protein
MCDVANVDYPHLSYNWDPIVALNVSTATYDDIDRYKSYHLRHTPGNLSDVVKRAAYFTKWTVKFRPIMFERLDPAPSSQDMGLMINETLAISWAMDLISADVGHDVRLTLKSMTAILYDLHYREFGTDSLLGWFQVVVDLARARAVNPIVEFSL